MRYFSFDAETDGLYGEAFAIGAVWMDEDGRILEKFAGQCIAPGIASEWVRENCLPHLVRLPEYPSRAALREAFWQFYMHCREGSVIIADVPYPVEAQLLRTCVEENLEERCFQGPYPLVDVASMLFARGLDPDTDRQEFSGYTGSAHNPLDDAIASCLCAIKILRM